MKPKHSEIFKCPRCDGGLEFTSDKISCVLCKTEFKYDDGLPLLFGKMKGEIQNMMLQKK